MSRHELYVSVDIETAGPIPGEFDLLSIGACLVQDPDTSFYCEIVPFAPRVDEEALKVSKLSLEGLKTSGVAAKEAMKKFASWIEDRGNGRRPIFVGFNAPFDWSFINWYFHRFLQHNPFGFAALDIKAFYMGLSGCDWSETSLSKLPQSFRPASGLKHNSLSDAQDQARIFAKMLDCRK